MAIINKREGFTVPSRSSVAVSPKSLGHLSQQDYEKHSQTRDVQAIIADARESWQEWYGNDPAAERFNGSH